MPIPSPPCRIERPFLDYVLSAVADAGFRRICLVVGPQNHEQLERYSDHLDRRVELTLAIQQKPLGTANALASAADFAGDDPFLMINSDNCYPTSALRSLHDLEQSGLIGFDRQVLATKGNIPADRISSFASIETDDQGFLVGITEKSPIRSDNDLISMNCWRFGPEIFTACRNIEPSQRGEY
ncbi:MAG: nucleotidyltransferase family protein, partial [Planctomycetaceae bacterium]|nr:nucleotidyltransferase family protein [Planctomycetaceae bacterium]